MRFLIGCLVLVAMAMPSAAEIYKYVDSNGVTIYTDNLSEVPADHRDDVQSYKEIKSSDSLPNNRRIQKKETSQEETPEINSVPKDKDQNTGTLAEIQALNMEKQKLDKEYETLVLQRQALKKNRPSLTTTEELEEFREKVNNLNKQIKAFDLKREVFETKIREFNLRNTRQP